MSNVVSIKEFKEKKKKEGKVDNIKALGKTMDNLDKKMSFDDIIKKNKENEERLKQERLKKK